MRAVNATLASVGLAGLGLALAGIAVPGAVAPRAAAQELAPMVRERIAIPQPPRIDGVRVQIGINLVMPGPTGETEEANALRERARRTVYQMAQRECDILREVMAKECRLETVNVNISANRQQGPSAVEGYSVTGSLGMRIVLQ